MFDEDMSVDVANVRCAVAAVRTTVGLLSSVSPHVILQMLLLSCHILAVRALELLPIGGTTATAAVVLQGQ